MATQQGPGGQQPQQSDLDLLADFIEDAVRKEKETDVPVPGHITAHPNAPLPQQQMMTPQSQGGPMPSQPQQTQITHPPPPVRTVPPPSEATQMSPPSHENGPDGMIATDNDEAGAEDVHLGEEDIMDGDGQEDEDKKPEKRKRGPRKPKPPLTVTYVDDPKLQINPSTCAIVRAPRTSKNATQKYVKVIFMGKPEAFKKKNLLYKRYKERTLEVELLKHIVIEKEKDFKEQLDFWKKRVWELEMFGGRKQKPTETRQAAPAMKPPPVAAMPHHQHQPHQHQHQPHQHQHQPHQHHQHQIQHMQHQHPQHQHQHQPHQHQMQHMHHGMPHHMQPPQGMHGHPALPMGMPGMAPPPPPPPHDHIDTVALAGAAASTAHEVATKPTQPINVNLEGNFGRFGEKWKTMFNMLVDYKMQFGHCNVPKSYNPSSLHSWVRNQRNNYKNLLSGKGDSRDMNQARIDALNSIGFTWWLGRITKDDQWEGNFQKLLEFKSVYGTFRVTKEYDKKLCRWVENQRLRKKMLEKYGEGKCKGMTWSRVEKLNSIGFTWSARDDPN